MSSSPLLNNVFRVLRDRVEIAKMTEGQVTEEFVRLLKVFTGTAPPLTAQAQAEAKDEGRRLIREYAASLQAIKPDGTHDFWMEKIVRALGKAAAGVTLNPDDKKTIRARILVLKLVGGTSSRRLVDALNTALSDVAMQSPGGIDFNSAKVDLQVRNGAQAIKFHIDPAQLAQLQDAPGFTPVIINIRPMNNLKAFLDGNEVRI
jgi:hypothetical protein